MTSSLHLRSIPLRRRHGVAVRAGFTLIEMLVVMGIILLLIAILLPAINRAYQQSVRNSMAADLQVISQALEAYHGDFGDYPRADTTHPVSGATILCWALIAPGPAVNWSGNASGYGYDGADGPGFRIRATGQGKVYGPYLPLDRFPLGSIPTGVTIAPNTTGIYSDGDTEMADRYGHVILYFPANKSVSPKKDYVDNYITGTLPPPATFNFGDNSKYLLPVTQGVSELSQAVFAYRLGHVSVTTGATGSMPLVGQEVPIVSSPYLLWSSGPDGQFGPQVAANSSGTYVTTGQDDDVTYPDQLNLLPPGFVP